VVHVCQIAGPLVGENLAERVVHVAYWFAWGSFFYRTEVLD
jgi:hypothetical protein